MSEMINLVQKFTDQLKEALEIGEKYKFMDRPDFNPKNVLITGLGGSGIGGTIACEILAAECPVPITVNKDYFLPAFVGKDTLVIVSSYSGNTEETLYAMEEAMKRNAVIVCITSGGKIADIAKEHKFDLILIPPGMPPRACL